MKEEKCIVSENRNIRKQYYLMQLKSEYISRHAKAGNFIMLAASRGYEPLLKRPFGILDVNPPFLRIYYEIVGKGTEMIASFKPGDKIDVVGPLGNSFPVIEHKNILLVAGGRGIAPLFFSIEHYSAANNVYLIYGAKSTEDLNLMEELEVSPLKEIFLYTEDGSKGNKGFVTTDIEEIIAAKSIDVTMSCGPDAMFESLYQTIGHLGTEDYVSLEAVMGCGFGICYSCAVKTVSGDYKKACIDGPVFRMEEIAWEK
jgi:dihydroorotate dehydrogenase electron transfer subunit